MFRVLTRSYTIESVGVVGLGLMGSGIAQSAAAAGYRTIGVDKASVLETSRSSIEASLTKLAKKHGGDVSATMGRLSFAESLPDVDLIIEAIVENFDVKLKFYQELGRDCLVASNTSSLPITPLALASGRPEKLVGLHYFNPVPLMKLVEVVKTEYTEPAAFDAVRDFAQSCGKTTVDCIDTPGFIVNRLLVPHIANAIAMAERKDASVPDIDKAMCLGAGQPMGPIQLADYVGLDTTCSILQGWVERYPDQGFFVPAALQRKVDQGKLGRKSGEGFYVWGDGIASTKPTGLSSDPFK